MNVSIKACSKVSSQEFKPFNSVASAVDFARIEMQQIKGIECCVVIKDGIPVMRLTQHGKIVSHILQDKYKDLVETMLSRITKSMELPYNSYLSLEDGSSGSLVIKTAMGREFAIVLKSQDLKVLQKLEKLSYTYGYRGLGSIKFTLSNKSVSRQLCMRCNSLGEAVVTYL